jgi:phosphoglycerate dehydrogenase-like enzyme
VSVIVGGVGDIDGRRRKLLEAGAEDATLRFGRDDHDAAPDALFVWAQQRNVLAEIVARHGQHLQWVHFRRVGIPDSTRNVFRQFPHVQLTNGSGASGIAVAEHALALLLALLKRLPAGALVINVGRGAVLDEAALVAALVSGP